MMANCCAVVSQAEISSLKDTLCAQQKLLQQLYNELEAEREAAATAASEALSVILRLQGEKAAIKMEAEQYKRLAEEKIGFAEESFAIIEDMITEKEMEVAELDYQVQTYRYQLMNMGFDVPAGEDISFPEHLLQRNDCLARDTSCLDHFKGKMAMLKRESSATDLELISKNVEGQRMGQEINEFASYSERKADVSTHEGISCFAGQIKELQLRVKEISGAHIPGFMSECQSPTMSSRPSAANLCSLSDSTNLQPEISISIANETGHIKHPTNLSTISEVVLSPRHSTVHDVFEVPLVDQESTSYESPNKDKQKKICQTSDILEIQDQVHPEDEPDWLKNLLQSIQHEKDLCGPSDNVESQDQAHEEAIKLIPKDEPDWPEKLLQSTHQENNLCKPSDMAAIDCVIDQPTTSVAVAFVQPTTTVDVSEPDLNKLNRSPEIIEVERPAESSNREEELKLLKEIKERLNVLQDEIITLKVNKSFTVDEPSLQPLAEVMFSFWL